MKKAAALLLAVVLAFTAVMLSGCSDEGNEAIVGEWTPSTVSIHGSTIAYSDLDTEGREFSFDFYSNGKCKIVIGGISNEGTYTFNETSVDIQYGGQPLYFYLIAVE